MKLKKKTKKPQISIRKLGPIGKAFQAGGNEVLNNPEKYNLMPIPTEEEIDGWFGDGQEVHDRFWEEAPYRTNGDRVEEIYAAFEHFKNRKHNH